MMTDKPQVSPLVADGAKAATINVCWPKRMPESRVDFGLLCADPNDPFLALLSWGSMRPEIVNSHYVQKPVVHHFERYRQVTIEESDGQGGNRSYAVELKHA